MKNVFFYYFCDMSKQEITHLLEEHDVKVTANRLLVAEALRRPLVTCFAMNVFATFFAVAKSISAACIGVARHSNSASDDNFESRLKIFMKIVVWLII